MTQLDPLTLGTRALLAAMPLMLAAWYHHKGLLRTGPLGMLASQAGLWGVLAVGQIAFHRPWYAFPDGIAAAIFGHAAWDVWRRGRKPRPEKAKGRVVNLGHRLAVVPGRER